MKKVAIVTGAAGGIGKEFVRQIAGSDVDEIWAVGRNEEKLLKLREEFGSVVVPVKEDLASGQDEIRKRLHDVEVVMLVNNAGTAHMGKFESMDAQKVSDIVDINCKACVVLAHMVLPFMKKGGKIINISSASSFQPNPYLSMYSASKVFLKNFSRALNMELKPRGITSIAVCPGWVDTDMLKNKDGKKIDFPGMVTAEKVVTKALKDAEKGKDISMSSFYNSYLRMYSKYMPTKIVMKQWIFAIRKYVS